jgi:membrane protease YdiL (CAAX protease family)
MSTASRRRAIVVVVAGLFAIAVAVLASGVLARSAGASGAELVRSFSVFAIEAGALALILRRAKLDPARAGLGLERRDVGRFFGGAGVGLATVLLTLAVAGLFGGLHVAIAPRTQWPLASGFAMRLASASFQCAFEEVAFRAGLVGVLALAFRREMAVAIPALVFGLAHAGNHGATVFSVCNTVIAALVFSALFLLPTREGESPSLAACTGFHVTWNFSLAAVLGVVVSGWGSSSHLVSVTIPSATWSGGAYGIEASPATTLVFAGAAVWLLGSVLRRRNLPGPSSVTE